MASQMSGFDYAENALKAGRKSKNKTCSKCLVTFNQVRDLERHTRNRKDLLCQHCNRTFCNQYHLDKHIRSMNEPKIITKNYQNPILSKTGYEDDPKYQELLEEKSKYVNNFEKKFTNHLIINERTNPGYTYQDLDLLITDIYSKQTNSFKVNIGIGFVLFNIQTGEYRYHYISSNNLLFEKAISITNIQDVERFMKKVCDLDLETNAYLSKPTSSWTLAGITNIEVWIFQMKDTPIGRPPIDLPSYIKDSTSIIALVHDGNKPITDDLCLFRCLALHEGGKRQGLEKRAKMLKKQLENQTGLCFDKGVCISHLPEVERIFEVSINVHSLQADGQADVIYLSRLNYPVMNVNLYKQHFSFISKFDSYANRFSCQLCDTTFDQATHLKRHVKTCCIEQQEIYVGGKYKKDLSLFQRLEKAGYCVPEIDRYYNLVSTFDMEAIQQKRNEKLQGRDILYKHIPATFSVHSNIPGHTAPQHKQSSGDPQKLIDELVSVLLLQQESASKIMHDKFKDIFSRLDNDIQELKKKVETLSNKKEKTREEMKLKGLETLLASLDKYCSQHIVLSFNGGRYDLPLIKRYLSSSLDVFEEKLTQVINKDRSYMVMASKRLKFLDVANFLAAGTSLSSFYKAYGVKEQKTIFPYSWFDTLEKLNARFLPTQEDFYSVLTNSIVTEEDYNQAVETWFANGWEKFGQYVEHYNNLDVTGMTEAVEKMLEVYKQWNLDLFKEALTLPGIAQKFVFRNLPEDIYFSNFGQEHKWVYKELREKGITGGPSIVFCRYHEAGVTKIRGGDQICKKVIGLDCNSMYLECTAREMATGWYTLREKKDGFRQQSRFSKESIQWLEHVSKERGFHIRHENNSPLGELRIGGYKVDGFCEDTHTVLEYHGCFTHSHCGKYYDAEKWGKTLAREEALREMGYNVESITSCEWHKDPRSQIWYDLDNTPPCTMKDIINGVKTDELFGFVKLSLHVPEDLFSKYSEFPPVFKNTSIELTDIGEMMQKFCERTNRTTGVKRSLISSMFGKDIVISTPLMKKYLEMGLVIDDIEWILDYQRSTCFEWFRDEVVDARRKADLDPDYAMIGECSKLLGNAFYGGTLIDRSKHTSVTIVNEERISNHIKSPNFKTMVELNDHFYEIEKSRKTVKHNTPITVGISVYSYAKLILIEFWEFVNKFLVQEKYEVMYTDTDSLYLAISEDSLDQCVKPELKHEWEKEKPKFLTSDDETLMEFDGRMITRKQFDKRTPGLFKVEFEGNGMACLNSKVVHAWGHDESGPKSKTSCKGSNKRRNLFGKEHFLSVLETQLPEIVVNSGFIKDNLTIKTYTQKKQGLGFFYAKRKVLPDGIRTVHLDI